MPIAPLAPSAQTAACATPRGATATRPPRVLLSTPLGPYEPYYYDTKLEDVWNQRFSRGCDIFTVTGHIHVHFAHAIAQNIGAPSVFLEYPTEQNFLDELARGYDFVGISGFQHQIDAVIRMGELVRERSPGTQVVVGAWAAMGIAARYPQEVWRRFADHLCVGEGIAFMRELLGEDPKAPISITHLPRGSYTFPWVDRYLPGNIGAIVASLGCTRGCDFCGPTTLLDRRRQELLSPQQVARELDRLWCEDPDLLSCAMYEEDSFTKKEYLMEVGRLIREETTHGLSRVNLMILGSIRSLEQWDLDDVARCGVSSVFIGVESKFAPGTYEKSRGRTAREVFRELHRRGVATIGGWMAGFDFQTRENIEEDLQFFVSLEPTMQQLTRVGAFAGTELYDRLVAEGRVDPDTVEWETVSFFGGGGLQPLHLEEHEVMALIDRGYRQLYETWGSCFARLFAVNLNGYEYCSQHADPALRYDRSRYHLRLAGRAYPFIKAMEVYAPNGAVRQRMRKLRDRYRRVVGPPTLAQRGLERMYLAMAGRAKRQSADRGGQVQVGPEPCKRYDYTGPRVPGERPYVVSKPNLDLPYLMHATAREPVQRTLAVASAALNGLESRLLRRTLAPELRECLPSGASR